MKLVKKIMMGVAALAATLALVSCGAKDDDANDMISGSNGKFTIEFDNDTGDGSRGYKVNTKTKHAGALVKISIDDASASGANGGVMGLIFDLKGNEEDKKTAKDFFIIGVRNDGKYYVSKLINVTDLGAYNFGTTLEENPATEIQIAPTSGTFADVTLSVGDGCKYIYVYYKSNEDGTIDWKLLSDNPASKDAKLSDKEFEALDFSEVELAGGTIDAETTGYSKLSQEKVAVYASVYKDGSLYGSWDFVGTYKDAEVIE